MMKIGRVFCLGVLPVLPGDEIDWTMSAHFELEMLRRRISIKGRLDIAAFYIPHDAFDGYPSAAYDYQGWAVGGVDSGVALGGDSGSNQLRCLPYWWDDTTHSSRAWPYVYGYPMIWERFFSPKQTALTYTGLWTGTPAWGGSFTQDDYDFGWPAANLPMNIWNQTTNRGLDAADYEITLGAALDMRDISSKTNRLESELDRQYDDIFYEDVVAGQGGHTSIDIEPRPEQLTRQTYFVDGRNQWGSDRETFGTQGGVHVADFTFNIPRRKIPRWGMIWIMGCYRYPHISSEERPMIFNNDHFDNFTFASGNPIFNNEPPYALEVRDIFDGNVSTQIAEIPHYHWWRQHPSFVHKRYLGEGGFVFAQAAPATNIGENFHVTDIADDNFQQNRYGHGSFQLTSHIDANRSIGDMDMSLTSGISL
jgi:hypothetical protein